MRIKRFFYRIKIRALVIRDLQNEKRDHPHLPHSPPSEIVGVRIVVISFRNIAKNLKNFRDLFKNGFLEI